MAKVEVSDAEVHSLTTAIRRRYGIDFTCYEMSSLKRRVVRALSVFKMESIHELWIKLLRDTEFIYHLMDEISVGLTSMFRDPIMWLELQQILKENDPSQLKVWHAGCSTGEEIYTMAILLKENDLLDKTKADATDINSGAIKIAEQGIYHHTKIEEYNRNYRQFNASQTLDAYYKKDKEGHMIFDQALKRHVSLSYNNLITDSPADTYDIIFCRNVLIYFDNDAKKNVISKMYDSLNDGGMLILGFYDSVASIIEKEKFDTRAMSKRIFYKNPVIVE